MQQDSHFDPNICNQTLKTQCDESHRATVIMYSELQYKEFLCFSLLIQNRIEKNEALKIAKCLVVW